VGDVSSGSRRAVDVRDRDGMRESNEGKAVRLDEFGVDVERSRAGVDESDDRVFLVGDSDVDRDKVDRCSCSVTLRGFLLLHGCPVVVSISTAVVTTRMAGYAVDVGAVIAVMVGSFVELIVDTVNYLSGGLRSSAA